MNLFTSPQSVAAFKRAVFMGTLAALFALVAHFADHPEYDVYAGIAGAFLARFVAEGGYDANRADNNDVNRADVGYTPLVHRNK